MVGVFRANLGRADLAILAALILMVIAALLAWRESRKVTAKVAEYSSLSFVLLAALFWTP